MINVFLAVVPLGFATGALVWTMASGARAQQRSDKWAEQCGAGRVGLALAQPLRTPASGGRFCSRAACA